MHRFSLYEPVEFIRHFLMDSLEWRKVRVASSRLLWRCAIFDLPSNTLHQSVCTLSSAQSQANGVSEDLCGLTIACLKVDTTYTLHPFCAGARQRGHPRAVQLQEDGHRQRV